MCGIAGIYLRDPSLSVDLNAMTDTLLDEIENRGQHATGFVAIGDEGTLEWQKAACKASTFIKHRRQIPDGARLVLGHTRWATQGLPAFMENNHPIKRGPFFIIHNGHVHNDYRLFREAERDPYGDVDSEAIAARLSHFGDLKFLGNVIEEIDGDAAVAAVDETKGDRLALARGRSSPLYVYNSDRIVVFASTHGAVKKAYESHVGRMKKNEPRYCDEGVMLFWQGEGEYWTKKLILPERKIVSSYEYTGGSYTPGAASTSYGKGKSKDVDTPQGYDWTKWHDYDIIDCDNCSTKCDWKDTLLFYDPDSKYTFNLCDECYDYLSFRRFNGDVPEGEWFEIGDDGDTVPASTPDPDEFPTIEELEGQRTLSLKDDIVSEDFETVNDEVNAGFLLGLRNFLSG